MKAVICLKYGGPEVLKVTEVEKPIAKDNQLLVKIVATAVNSGDVRLRALRASAIQRALMRVIVGFHGPRKKVLGVVFSGVVEAIGKNVTTFKVGDEVYGATGFSFGTYAEYVAVNEKSPVFLKPANASFEEAASIPFGATTAIYFLEKAGLGKQSNQEVLIYGATGAVGSAAVQIAKYHGANVTAVCSEEGEVLVRKLGVDNVVLYTKEDFAKNGKTYDIIFDAVGKKPKAECAHSLKENGKYVSVEGYDTASEKKEQLEFLKKIFEENKYQAIIDKTFTLDEIVEAHRYVDLGRKKGNVVVKVQTLI